MSRLSVRVRATLAATTIVAIALGVAAAVLIGVLRGSLVKSASDEAARRADAAAGVLVSSAGGETVTIGRIVDPDIKIVPKSAPSRLSFSKPVPSKPGRRVAPKVIARWSPSGPGDPASTSTPPPAEDWAPPTAFTVVNVPVVTVRGEMVVQARASLEPVGTALRALQSLLLPGIPGLLLLVAALTWLAVGRALAPVSAIRAEMADITASDLHRRVPVPRSRDEIARLAETMNRTLDRLESAVNRHKRFVADAAHELRSPLAILRTRLELAPPEPLTAEALTDVDRIHRLTADLLLLARLDAGEPPCDEEVDVGQVAAEEATRSRPRPRIQVRFEVASDVVVRGSAEQLRRLVANLVDNAVRHADSRVTVRVAHEECGAVLEVRDDGPGIPVEHRTAVFDRFTRLDEARDRDAGGSGLGLAIARDIAVRHGGSLDVVGGTPGAVLRACLPVRTPRPRRAEEPAGTAAAPAPGVARRPDGRCPGPPAGGRRGVASSRSMPL